MERGHRVAGILWASILVAGCATSRAAAPIDIRNSTSPALAIKPGQRELIVAVSPVRKTTQLLGSSGLVLGAGIDAMVNEKYRKRILEALSGYDAGGIFEQRLRERIQEGLGRELTVVAPITSTAGFQTRRDAEETWWRTLAKNGHDQLIDLDILYGIFGYDGVLAVRVSGKIVRVPDGKVLWKNAVFSSTSPLLANAKLSDPAKQLGLGMSSPRFSVDEEAVARWTQDNGRYLKEQFELAVDSVVSAIVADLELGRNARGEYCLGKNLMNRRRFEEADAHFRKAIELDPEFVDAMNARALNLARNRQIDDAIALSEGIVERFPEYGPAHFNLGWWYALEKGEPAAARRHYEKARALGMPREPKIEKKLDREGRV